MKKILFLTFLSSFAFGLSEEELAKQIFDNLNQNLLSLTDKDISEVLNNLEIKASKTKLNTKKILTVLNKLFDKTNEPSAIRSHKANMRKLGSLILGITGVGVVIGYFCFRYSSFLHKYNAKITQEIKDELKKKYDAIWIKRTSSYASCFVPKKNLKHEAVILEKLKQIPDQNARLTPLFWGVISSIVSAITGFFAISSFYESSNANLYKEKILLIQKNIDLHLNLIS